MDIAAKFVLALHILGLVLLMGTGLANARIGPLFGTSSDEQKGVLFKLLGALRGNLHIGLGLLWVTGIALIFMRGFDITQMSIWFWVKMLFVVIVSATVGIGASAARKFETGDVAASGRVAMMGMASGISGIIIIICAVFAFQ